MRFLLFLALALLWGGSFVAIGSAVSQAPPAFSAFMRLAMSSILLAVIVPLSRKKLMVDRSNLKLVWFGGLMAQGFPFLLLFWAEQRISAGLAGIFNGTVPIWTFLLGQSLFRSETGGKYSKKQLFGVFLGVTGILAIFLPKIQLGQPGTGLGMLAVAAMALSYATGIHVNRLIFSRGVDVYSNSFQQAFASAVFLGIFSFVVDGLVGGHHLEIAAAIHHGGYWWSILYLGWASSAVAFLIFFYLIRSWGALAASSVTYLIPIIALVLDFWVNGARPGLSDAIGCFSILAGVFLIQN